MKWKPDTLPNNWKEWYWGEESSLEEITRRIAEDAAKLVVEEIMKDGRLIFESDLVTFIALDGELIITSPLDTWAEIYDQEGRNNMVTALRAIADKVEAMK